MQNEACQFDIDTTLFEIAKLEAIKKETSNKIAALKKSLIPSLKLDETAEGTTKLTTDKFNVKVEQKLTCSITDGQAAEKIFSINPALVRRKYELDVRAFKAMCIADSTAADQIKDFIVTKPASPKITIEAK